MRGNLVWKEFHVSSHAISREVIFESDENGYWEIVDGKIIPYHEANSFKAEFHSTLDTASIHAPQAKQEELKKCYEGMIQKTDEWYEREMEKLKSELSAKQEMVDMDAPLLSVRDVIENSFWYSGNAETECKKFEVKALIELAKQKMK